MRYTENLKLKLPEQTDPVDVDVLSENFEKLDKAGASGSDIAVGMKVGDIVYSTRNLEEETDGVLIACDQRTIDLDAYPDIPRDALFWPYAELVFSDGTVAGTAPRAPQLSDANTDEWIYSREQNKTFAYSLTEKLRYSSEATTYEYAVIRLTEDRLLLKYDANSNSSPFFANNDLTAHTTKIPSTLSTAIKLGAIARIDDTRFFLVVFVDSGSVSHGFYVTNDGFLTLQSISMPATAASDIAGSRFDQTSSELKSYTMIESPFYPIKKMSSGEMLVTFKGTTTICTMSYSSEAENRDNLKKIIPTVWRTSGNYANIAVGAIGGDALFDWLWDTMNAVELPSGSTHNKSVQIHSDRILPLDGKYLLVADFGRHIGSGNYVYDDSYFVLVDLETDEFKVSERYDYTDIHGNIRFNILKSLLYRKEENELYYFKSYDAVYVINLSDLTLATVSPILDGLGTPQAYANYMPSAVTAVFDNKYDKRMWERGIEAINKNALCILNRDMTAMNFSSPLRPVSISTGGSSERQISPSVSAPGNLTEYDGDLYLGQGASLYKIPLKTKRQMPYIEHGYMKVLDDKEGA